jgi:Holliday junction resolvase RusA-like endonuclease
MIEFQVPGKPVGKARPRVTRHGTYTPKNTKEYMKKVLDAFQKAGGYYIEGFVFLDILAYFPIPQSYTKKQRLQIEADDFWYGKKPDKDNISKSVMDALNGVAYKDDSLVVLGRTLKKYCRPDEEPRLIVRIRSSKEKTYEQWGF